MRDTRFENRSSEWIGDMTVWLRANAEDNSEQEENTRGSHPANCTENHRCFQCVDHIFHRV